MPDPLFINASAGSPAYDARELRRALSMFMTQATHRFGARNGIHPGGSPAVTISAFTVSVADTKGIVYPALNSQQGAYLVQIPGKSLTVTTNNPSNPRKDIVVCQVWDHDEDASGLRNADIVYIAGTAAPSPSEPAIPAGAFRMATIDVPAGSGNPTLTYNAPFTVATGGILPIRDSSELPADSLYFGQFVYDQALKELQVRAPTIGWTSIAQVKKAWTAYTPVVTGGGSATFSTISGVWKNIGTDTDMVFFNVQLEVSAAGSGSSTLQITAPTNIDRNRRQVIHGHVEYPAGSPDGLLRSASLVSFTGGSGATWDRLRFQQGASAGGTLQNMTGAHLLTNTIVVFEGIYRFA